MMRRMWMGLLALALGAGGGLAACKRQEKAGPGTNAPAVARPPRLAGPTTQELVTENRAQLLENMYIFAPLVGEKVELTPDGESWTRFANGLMIHDLRPSNEGQPPRLGQTVSVAYVGTFPGSGRVFDQRDAVHPLVFKLGSKDLIEGFSLGLSSMRQGAKRRMFVPPELGYGARGNPGGNIPGGQALIFEVELLSISGEGLDITLEDLPQFEPLGPPAPATRP